MIFVRKIYLPEEGAFAVSVGSSIFVSYQRYREWARGLGGIFGAGFPVLVMATIIVLNYIGIMRDKTFDSDGSSEKNITPDEAPSFRVFQLRLARCVTWLYVGDDASLIRRQRVMYLSALIIHQTSLRKEADHTSSEKSHQSNLVSTSLEITRRLLLRKLLQTRGVHLQ